MSRGLVLLIMMGLVVLVSGAAACERGAVCWTDLSDGTAVTELRFRAQGGERTAVIEPGSSTFRFVELLQDSPLLPSDWLCVQGRQRNAAGVYSGWVISEHEGVCHQTAVVVPAPEPDPPPVVEPPPVQPEPEVQLFSDVTNHDGVLAFSYQLADCPRGVQQTTSAIRDGRKTITLRCRR